MTFKGCMRGVVTARHIELEKSKKVQEEKEAKASKGSVLAGSKRRRAEIDTK